MAVSRTSGLSLTNGQKSSQASAGAGVLASGGTITEYRGRRYHTFTSSGTFQVDYAPEGATFEYVALGGGAGGASGGSAGGGGAGGARMVVSSLTAGSYPVVVGAGGAVNTDGQNTTFYGDTGFGGGRGNTSGYQRSGLPGGCGGGGGGNGSSGGATEQGDTIATDVRNRGHGGGYGNGNGGAGGGGGGLEGGGGTSGQYGGPGGNGGSGWALDLYLEWSTATNTGHNDYYGGGGGGSGGNSQGAGGTGGGGTAYNNAVAQTGSGGGGGNGQGAGGLVLIRYVI